VEYKIIMYRVDVANLMESKVALTVVISDVGRLAARIEDEVARKRK
ncbi:hypothetical protein A2U01_0003830, partial [Trifolium medium]|nr:hypothetical protein [Trifolium medium]